MTTRPIRPIPVENSFYRILRSDKSVAIDGFIFIQVFFKIKPAQDDSNKRITAQRALV